jgi:hypothetical protein
MFSCPAPARAHVTIRASVEGTQSRWRPDPGLSGPGARTSGSAPRVGVSVARPGPVQSKAVGLPTKGGDRSIVFKRMETSSASGPSLDGSSIPFITSAESWRNPFGPNLSGPGPHDDVARRRTWSSCSDRPVDVINGGPRRRRPGTGDAPGATESTVDRDVQRMDADHGRPHRERRTAWSLVAGHAPARSVRQPRPVRGRGASSGRAGAGRRRTWPATGAPTCRCR